MTGPADTQEIELKAGMAAQPVKARAVMLDREMAVGEAFRSIAAGALDHLQANAEGVLAGAGPEYLHQMRVALRRMRSVFRVFAPAFPEGAMAPFVEEMRWLARALGPARDWDVFVDETLPRFSGKIRGQAVRTALGKSAEDERRKANRAARRAVASARYRRFTLSLTGWLAAAKWADKPGAASVAFARPILEFAAATLERRHARARKRGRRLASCGPAELHRLRIAIKKLRYAGDFFSTLYDRRRARRTLRRLSRLQDILGSMNDAAQAARLLADCRASMARAARAAAARALRDWTQSRALVLRRKLEREWAAFRKQETFW